jgi:hypothetical protein
LHAFKRFENVWSSLRHMQDLHNHVSALLLLYNSLDYLFWADEAVSSLPAGVAVNIELSGKDVLGQYSAFKE